MSANHSSSGNPPPVQTTVHTTLPSQSTIPPSSTIHSTPPPPPPSSSAGHQTTSSSSTTSTSSSTTSTTPISQSPPKSTTSNTSPSFSVAKSSSSSGTIASSSTSSFTTWTSVATGTNANGSTYTTTVVRTQALAPTAVTFGASTRSSSSSSTGAIAGGAAGGLVVLVLGSLLLFFCLRRRKKERDPFDGDFDPDRVVGSSPDPTLPRLDLDATPYAYEHYEEDGYKRADENGMPLPLHMGYDMAQRSNESAGFPLTDPVPPSHRSESPPMSYPQDNIRRALSTTTYGVIPSSKERDRRLFVANDGYSRDSGVGEVVQHQDGGRLGGLLDNPYDVPRREIPPSYDSVGANRTNLQY